MVKYPKWYMQQLREEQLRSEAAYIIEHNATVRYAARNLMIPKSTVSKHMQELKHYDIILYDQVQAIFKRNWAERFERMHRVKRWKNR